MQTNFRIKLSVLTLMIFIIVGANHSPWMLQHSASSIKVDETDSTLNILSKYRAWTLVNPVPVKMEPAVAFMCAAAPRRSPHEDKFVSVYVNETGRQAMMTQLSPKFPQGSMIVKEKLSSKDAQSPELLTAMIKREKGYHPESGDWEYLVIDGSASKVEKRGKLADCNSCHVAYDSTDYVTRTYLSDEVRRRLK